MKYFELAERKSWGGPDFVNLEIRIRLSLLDESQVQQLRQCVHERIARLPADEQPRIRVGLIDTEPHPTLRVAISIQDDVTGFRRDPEDPVARASAETLETGLEPLLRAMPARINGRYLCLPPIPYSVGDTVRIVNVPGLELTGKILAIDAEHGLLRLNVATKAWGDVLTEERDVDLLDVRPSAEA